MTKICFYYELIVPIAIYAGEIWRRGQQKKYAQKWIMKTANKAIIEMMNKFIFLVSVVPRS